MDRNSINNKHKEKFNHEEVRCEDISEREYLIGLIRQEFPDLHPDEVERSVGYACRIIKSPRPMKEFLDCVQENIGKV